MEQLIESRLIELRDRLSKARKEWAVVQQAGQPNTCEEAIRVDILSALVSELGALLGYKDTRY